VPDLTKGRGFSRLLGIFDSGAGERIRSLAPNLGKREITVSPRLIGLTGNSLKYTGLRDLG
jgi:hypothetical protein